MAKPSARWLLLTHQLPAHPSNVRVKVWRKLQSLGAVPIKNSIYALPNLAGTREDFEWLRKEIIQMKGDASVFLADSVTNVDDKEIVAAFQKARDKDYEGFIREASHVTDGLKSALQGQPLKPKILERLERRWAGVKMDWERLQKVDFFKNPQHAKAESLAAAVQKSLQEAKALTPPEASEPPEHVALKSLKGKTWVTRTSPHIDRLACAWLIRRHIDPKARFKFVSEPYRPSAGELRFDMAEGEFTHFGEWCSFETFLYRTSLKNPVLKEIAEIIHDIDLKDRKFGRIEAPGIGQIIKGLCRLHPRDSGRLEAGIAFFDALRQSLENPP